jgi:flagellar hook-associated protein 1
MPTSRDGWAISAGGAGGSRRVSITTIMQTGLLALQANQQALKTTSNNVANVNTDGYARLDVQFVSRHDSGGIQGVEIDVRRVANAFLAAAEMRGAADVASAEMMADFMDRAQALLGDPSGDGTVFSTLDAVFQSFGALSVDPASPLRRATALSDVQTLLTQLETTAQEIAGLREEAHVRAGAAMEEANALLGSIAQLNQTIQRARVAGTSAAEAETEQARMLDRLSEIIDVRLEPRNFGGVDVRTTDGMLLADVQAGRLAFASTTDGEPYPGVVMIPPRGTTEAPFDGHLDGGELKGLLTIRDRELPNLQLAFGEFAAGTIDALNAAHNAGSPVPAPAQLDGRNTGLLATDRLNFSGVTRIGVVNGDGVLQRSFTIDFGAGTITDNAGAVTNFTNSVGALATAIDTALGADGAASFAGGSLSVSTNGGRGLVVADDPASPARRAGAGFAHVFGLNDLVSKSTPVNYATGLSGADAHGFTAGQTLTFAVRDADGAIQRKIDFTVGAGTTIAALRADIDAALVGYGATGLDASGRLTLNPVGAAARIDVIADATSRGDTGIAMSELFGLGETAPAHRAFSMSIRSDLASDPSRLTTATADLGAAVVGTTRVLNPGDGRGALALEAAGTTVRYFSTAGGLAGQSASVADYAARLAGHAGLRAESLAFAKTAAESIRQEVHERRINEEGVNLDEELVKMTTYQQSYAAASRLIQAARDLYDIILGLV